MQRSSPSDKVRQPAILGGGTAGRTTAATLSCWLGDGVAITVVESDAIGTIGVGEATIPPILRFDAHPGLDEASFMRATQGDRRLPRRTAAHHRPLRRGDDDPRRLHHRVPRRGGLPHRLLAAALLLAPVAASAHAFVQPYTLPVPFAMYSTGAAAALVLSFAMVSVFAALPTGRATSPGERPAGSSGTDDRPMRPVAGAIGLGLLGLCIVAGLFGTRNPYANINMTLFWIVFVLGVPYLTVLLGDFYARINPWRMLVHVVRRLGGPSFDGVWHRAAVAGSWPALGLYMAFIWLELFGDLGPRGLSLALLAYTLINLGGAWLLGEAAWFRQGEFFGVLLRLLGDMRHQRATQLGGVVFILFMLSSTAFDGLHQTVPWVTLFWKHLYPAVEPWFTTTPEQHYALSTRLYYAWQWLALLLSPMAYLLAYVLFVWLSKLAAWSSVPLRALVLRFAFSWVPIAFVYHVTHYYTLILAQGGQIVRLASDPLGRGWNLFGTADWAIQPAMLGMDAIWHTQVGLILAGHMASVYLAHVEALRVFGTRRRAACSQVPMLVVMVLFTVSGLWILSLPIVTG